MLILTGGRERSASEYNELLAEADFEVEEIIPTAGFSILLAKRR